MSENWEDTTQVDFTGVSTDLATIAPSFGAAHLMWRPMLFPDGKPVLSQ